MRRTFARLADRLSSLRDARRRRGRAPAGFLLSPDEARELWQPIVQNSPDCIKLLDAEGRLLWMNGPGQQLMDVWDLRDVVGRRWADFWGGASQASVESALSAAHGGAVGRFTAPCATLAGRVKWWNVVVTRIPGRRGLLLAMSRDVTDLVTAIEAQSALAVAERVARDHALDAGAAKDRVIATVSHELRTPLNAILGWAVLLQTDSSDPAAVEIGRQIERLAVDEVKLVADLVQAPARAPERVTAERASLGAVVRDVVASLEPLVSVKALEMRLTIPPGEIAVAGDARRLRQVFVNVLGNAVKFTPAGGRIAVDVAVASGQAIVVVQDSGIGVSREFLDRMFDRFAREDRSDVHAAGGLGLGLAIARGLVELHDGTITASSDGPGTGTRVTIVLPCAPAAPARPRIAGRAGEGWSPDAGRERMLRLDGIRIAVHMREESLRELVAAAMGQLGASVIVTPDPHGVALHAAVDVLVSEVDAEMRIEGRPLSELRQALAGIRAIAVAPRHGTDRETAFAAGFDAVIHKPIVPSELAREIVSLGARRVH